MRPLTPEKKNSSGHRSIAADSINTRPSTPSLAFALRTDHSVSTRRSTGTIIVAWVFLMSRPIGLGMLVPEAAYEAPTKQVCEAVRATVELVVDRGVNVSECRDRDKVYIGVPIYGERQEPPS